MRFFIGLVVGLCFFVSGKSLSQTVTWSQPLQEYKKEPYLLVLGSNEDGNIFLLRSSSSLERFASAGFRNRTYRLECFSPELTLIWSKDLKTSFEGGYISDVKLINEKIIVSSYFYDKKSKRYYFYVQYLDNQGQWIGKPTELDNFEYDALYDDETPGLLSSKSQEWISFSYRKLNKDKNEQLFRVILLDTNLMEKYKKEIEIPIPENLFTPDDIILTDQGSFFILGMHYLTAKKIKSPDQSYCELFGYNYVLDKIVNTSIKGETRYLTDVGIMADNMNRAVVIAGFYSEKTTYSVAGVFYFTLTEDSLHETPTVYAPFSTEYLLRFMTDYQESRELVNYSIDRLIVRKDGGVGIIAESIYEVQRSTYDPYMQSSIYHYYYHYGNVMIISVDPDGKIRWNNIISKDQNSVDDGGFFSSYSLAITGGRLAAVYNKHIDDESSVLVSFVGANGVQSTNVLFNEMDKVQVLPHAAKQIDEDILLIPAYKQNKFFIATIGF